MANPQPNEFTKISNELYGAIMQRDFSKRQRNIIDLIIRMSYGCGMKSCFLRPSDFSVVGVQKQHIGKELKYLEQAKVIVVNGNEITLNKDYDQWSISLVKGYDEEKLQTIIRNNLEYKAKKMQTAGYQNSNSVTKTVTDDSYQNSNKVTETVTLADESYQNSNHGVTKTVTTTPLEALQDAGYRALKESIKEIAAATDEPPISPIDDQQLDECGYVEEIEGLMMEKTGNPNFTLDFKKGLNQAIQLFKAKVPIRIIKQGIEECFERNPDIKSFTYCIGRIREIQKREIDLQKAIQHEESYELSNQVVNFNAGYKNRTRGQPERLDDPISTVISLSRATQI